MLDTVGGDDGCVWMFHWEEAERFGDGCARPVGRELVLMDLRPNFFYQFEYSGDIVAGHVGRDLEVAELGLESELR